MTTTMTVAQALMTFLSRQYTVDGDIRQRTIAGTFGIFGHGNVAGIGQALRQLAHDDPGAMPYHQARNEQAMVHESVGFARMNRRRSTFASAASVGPGAANMLTGAALATANRMPALLLPSDTFATRVADPVLQQLEHPHDTSLQVTDAFRPLSRFFDRVDRPEQLFSIALAAMRVLTDPAETGAVTIALPEDVQAETLEVPEEFLAERDWHLRRPLPEWGPLTRAVAAIEEAQTPLIIAGGGVLYSGAEDELRTFAEATGIPVATTQAGGGVLDWNHPLNLGGIGATGSTAANRIAAEADVVIGIGTRYSDFTTASRTVFGHPDVRFVNLNVAGFDAFKHGSRFPIVADAREGIRGLREHLGDHRVSTELRRRVETQRDAWTATVDAAVAPTPAALPGQAEIIGAVNRAAGPRDVVIQAAGSLPGDLQKLWRTRNPLGYHVEYAFSCMGYEIAGGLGVRRAIDAADALVAAAGDDGSPAPSDGSAVEAADRNAIVMVGDGSYLMLHTELVTAVAEGLKLIVVLVQNHGYASIGHLSETVGAPRFGTWYRKYDAEATDFRTDEVLPVDLAANARSYGIDVVEIAPGPDASTRLAEAVAAAREAPTSTLIHIDSDPLVYAPDGEGWWDVPVAETSTMSDTQAAREEYEIAVKKQRPLL
ncbi:MULTISPECIES: 3D-(3,5/4)-trihydroxycyclohexane-1,2-dione acylhydrolase (decyclizing) [unclassified Brevibacterium]|uniref:3D-(3,5/4)-trihydroxycyclohexane-1,2-dione acylhydrolase (decyclizing) n=1 Tax=unclassified Brevibacterium TaxID=2614124 RepID=UPI00362C3578